MNEHNKTETNSQMQKTNNWILLGERRVGRRTQDRVYAIKRYKATVYKINKQRLLYKTGKYIHYFSNFILNIICKY